MKYRADIDGLRAIAVLSVVLFHLAVPGFQGGYVGVDVFFVISGYLITTIIKHKYESHEFLLSDFYFRRIRRLIPPLIATVMATSIVAAMIMTPYDLADYSRSAVAALFSLSNVVFYFESGYWDTASELKPLLHTWSLGVEEQFYLFWPALIVGLLSLRRYVTLGVSLTLITVLGAALCVWYTTVDQSAAFYLLPFRVFQFSLGALLIPLSVALQGSAEKQMRGAVWVGLLLILVSVVAFDAETHFPGWAVLLPTIGAGLVLLSGTGSGESNSVVRALMENPFSVWVGRVSYSMYLVHWPVIALFRYHFGLELTLKDQFVLAAATLLMTCMLHYGVERRFYQRASGEATGSRSISSARFMLRTFVAAGFVALLAASAWLGDGWAWRYPSPSLSTEQIEQGERDRFREIAQACRLDRLQSNSACNFEAETQMLVLGNSTEVDGFNFVNAGFGQKATLNLIAVGGTQGCKEMRYEAGRFYSSTERCQRQFDALFDPVLMAQLDVVFYSANRPYAGNKKIHLAMLRELKRANPEIRIVTLGGYINTERPCSFYINKNNTTDACALPGNVSYFADDPTDEKLFSEFRAIEALYIDRVDLLCKNRVMQTCRTRTAEGVPALYDRVHHSLEFAEMSGKMYAQKHGSLLGDLNAR